MGKIRMTNIFFLALLLFSLACRFPPAASRVFAASWEDEKDAWEEMSSTKFYKDPGYAAKLSLNFLPVDNGHFYVGEVGKGIWFSVGQTVSLAALAVSVLNSQSRSKQDLKPIWTDGMVIAASVGGFSYLALKVWSAYDAAAGARRYNETRGKKQSRWNLTPDGVMYSRRW